MTNEAPADGYFELGMAKWNSGTQTVGLETSAMQYNAATDFDVGRQGYTIPCSSPAHLGLACIFRATPVTNLGEISTARDVLQIYGLSGPIPPGGSLTVQTTGSRFRNPASTRAISTYEARS